MLPDSTPEPPNLPDRQRFVEEKIDVPVYYIFVGGAADTTYLPVKGYYDAHESLYNKPAEFMYAMYKTHDTQSEIVEYIKGLPYGVKINLIGHSWGGDTAALAAVACGRIINILVTVDPVSWFGVDSWFGPSYSEVVPHAATWIDINATGGGLFEGGNIIATIGGKWNHGPESTATPYYEVPVPHAYFEQMLQHKTEKLDGKSAEQVLLEK